MTVAVVPLLIAALGGAAIGLERQWSGHASGPDARFGGIRTFTLLGGAAGIAGLFAANGWIALAAVLAGTACALIAVGYAASARHDIDATTEMAGIIVIAAGVLSGAGQTTIASGIFAITAVLLVEKSRLHALAEHIDSTAFRASVRFAALALVVLPALPSGSYGPFGAIRPRELWAIVLLFSALSFAAWIGRRLLGATEGTVVAGLLGGLISSTSVTLSFARASRGGGEATALALGTIGASLVMLVRVLVASAILNWPLARSFAGYMWPAAIVGALAMLTAWRFRVRGGANVELEDESPLQLKTALQMAAAFQVVLIAIGAVVAWWSLTALLLTSAMVGLTDLDALTLSLARTETGLTSDAVGRALTVGVLSNTSLKLGVAATVGTGKYRLMAGAALGAMAVALAASIWH